MSSVVPFGQRALVVVGTRPEVIKMAPVVRSLRHAAYNAPVIDTGQHPDMVRELLRLFAMTPEVVLPLRRESGSINEILAQVIAAMSRHFTSRDDVVLVQGDTTSAMAAAIAGYNAGARVVHVEAGLRSGNLRSPFPEEGNRRIISEVAELHLAPTPRAKDLLLGEGHDASRVLVVGNPVIDSLNWVLKNVSPSTAAIGALGLEDDRPMVLATLHRRESWDAGLANVAEGLRLFLGRHPDVRLLLPLHKNPVVRDTLGRAFDGLPNASLVEPLAYPEFVHALARSAFVLTDSGGVQEEGPALGKRVLVARATTERPEGLEWGSSRLIGTETSEVLEACEEELENMSPLGGVTDLHANPFGDGLAGGRVAQSVSWLLGLGERPPEFWPLRPSG